MRATSPNERPSAPDAYGDSSSSGSGDVQGAARQHVAEAHPQGRPGDPLRDVRALRPEITADQRGHGEAEAEHGHEDDHVQVERDPARGQGGGAQAADDDHEERKGQDLHRELQAGGHPESQEPAEQRGLEPPSRQRPVPPPVLRAQDHAEVHRGAEGLRQDRGVGRARDPHPRKPPVAEDPEVVEDGVDQGREDVDDQDHDRLAPAGEEAGQRRHQHDGKAAGEEDLCVDDFMDAQLLRVPRHGKDGLRQRLQRGDDQTGRGREVDALPDHGADALRAGRPPGTAR